MVRMRGTCCRVSRTPWSTLGALPAVSLCAGAGQGSGRLRSEDPATRACARRLHKRRAALCPAAPAKGARGRTSPAARMEGVHARAAPGVAEPSQTLLGGGAGQPPLSPSELRRPLWPQTPVAAPWLSPRFTLPGLKSNPAAWLSPRPHKSRGPAAPGLLGSHLQEEDLQP